MGAADDMPSLLEDPAALRALLLAALEQRDAAMAEREALAVRNENLHHLLLTLKRRQLGQKSERLPEDQLLFAFKEGQRSKALREQQANRRRGNHGQLPPHLPRIEQVLMPEQETCPCCAGALVEIGADSAERLDVLPARFRVLVTGRPKLRRLRRSGWCPVDCRRRPPSLRCWWPAMPTICHCIVRHRCWRGRG
jgi:hypothetical protein